MSKTRGDQAHDDEPSAAEASDELTIEQLAAATGLAFTTIRLYQQRGLLPPPERRGRVGYYGPAHRARLELISSLQERGYSLAAIKDLVDTWQEGRSLTQVLGLEARAAAAMAAPAELRLSATELADRLGGLDLTPELLARAYGLGLVTVEGDVVVVRDPAYLDVGTALVGLGVPVDEVLDEYEHLRSVADELAGRFTAVFERNLWQPFEDAGLPAAQLPALTEALGRLGPLAEQIVEVAVRRAIADRAQAFLAERAKDLG